MEMPTQRSINDFSKEAWSLVEQENFPFTDYDFLSALETSGSVGERTGWSPRYLAWQDSGALDAVALAYEKTNSYGEYIFDWQWADAYERFGAPYYPKLTSAIPFTPATGSKLLRRPGAKGAPPRTFARRSTPVSTACWVRVGTDGDRRGPPPGS